MKFNFNYSVDSEIKRVLYTLSKYQFYQDNGYKVKLPEGVNTSFTDTDKSLDLTRVIEAELKVREIQKYEKILLKRWQELDSQIEKFLDNLSYPKPEEIFLTFTQYGVGGSYGPPNKIIYNIINKREILETVVHELIHCIIEEPVVNHYGLTHWEKESLVEYLIIENLNNIFPKYIYRNNNRPSEELLRKVGLR